jgi:hypothetical protein
VPIHRYLHTTSYGHPVPLRRLYQQVIMIAHHYPGMNSPARFLTRPDPFTFNASVYADPITSLNYIAIAFFVLAPSLRNRRLKADQINTFPKPKHELVLR